MSYDQYQTVFALSSLANWVSRRHGVASAIQADYQRVLHATLGSEPAKTAIGTWDVVWGPQIWQAKDSVRSDNAMFVAKSSDVNGIAGDVYVVAICATNSSSPYDWLVEDFDVASTVEFAKYDPLASSRPVAAGKLILPKTPVVSMGTALGVWHLLNMVSPASAAAPGTTLDAFLKTVEQSGATVIFTGHSLGGALSPTMATWFKSRGLLAGCKDVYCYATAGATPGNAAFAEVCAQMLPPPTIGEKPYQAWNHDMWNTLDVVPHAWVTEMLSEIPHIYDNGMIPGVEAFVFLARINALASGITYSQIANQSLQGTRSGSPPTDTFAFLKQMAIQHGTAYQTLIADWLKPVVPLGYALRSAEIDTDALLQVQATRLDEAAAGIRALQAKDRAAFTASTAAAGG